MNLLVWLVSFVACVAAPTGSAAAQCSRHFYNYSPAPYTFSSSGGGLCNGLIACVIKPHTTSDLTYLPLPFGHLEVISVYGTHAFGLSGCYIEHSGPTGDIAVNEPADGDITTCGRDWACPSLRGKNSH